MNIENLLELCGLKDKYLSIFKAQDMTLERFEKLAQMN